MDILPGCRLTSLVQTERRTCPTHPRGGPGKIQSESEGEGEREGGRKGEGSLETNKAKGLELSCLWGALGSTGSSTGSEMAMFKTKPPC